MQSSPSFSSIRASLNSIWLREQPNPVDHVASVAQDTVPEQTDKLYSQPSTADSSMPDGQYGMMTNGITYVPPKSGAATIAVTKEGQIILGKWGADFRLSTGNTDLAAWRQNAALLIDQGVINPLTSDGAAWGGTILNSTYTWRSGLGITPNGSLLYAAGNSLSAKTLGIALQSAGAVMAMQTDINPYWVRAFLYQRSQQGNFHITKLNPSMYGTGYEYLNGTQRDFFYMTYTMPIVPPSQKNKLPRQ